MNHKEFTHRFPELFPHYRYEASLFFEYCRQEGLSFTEEAIRAYLLTIPRRLKFGTFNKRLAAAKKVVIEWVKINDPKEFAAVAFHLKAIKGMKRADKSVVSDRIHTPEQIKILRTASGKRTEALIFFLVSSGVRRAEAASIHLNDLSFDGEFYNIRVVGKGNKERVIPVPGLPVDFALSVFKGNAFLFETRNGKQYDPDEITSLIAKVGKKVGIKSSPHRMRHTFATNFLEKNPGKFKELSEHLGHGGIQITMDNYAHNKMSKEDLNRATRDFY